MNALELNRDKILRLVSYLDDALDELGAISRIDRKAVLGSRERFAMEQLFYRVAMVCIDLCYHVVSRADGTVPETYRGCFGQMVSDGFIEPDLGQKLETLAGLRNIIAHAYVSLDYGLLYDYLNDLDSIRRFRNVILALVGISHPRSE